MPSGEGMFVLTSDLYRIFTSLSQREKKPDKPGIEPGTPGL